MKKIIILSFLLFILIINSRADIVEELTLLNNLFKEGAITKEEFTKAKSIILKANNTTETKEEKQKTDEKNKEKEDKEITKELEKNNINKKKYDQDLSKTFISLDEINEIGSYEKLTNFPKGLFNTTSMSSKALASKAAQEMYKTFVQNKNLMEKNPENMMKAMGYFEVFYMQKVKEGEKYIDKFKKNYPNINWKTKKEVKSLYSLNQARKSMRESIGLTLNDDPEEALERYMHMHNFLSKGEKTKQNLTKMKKN